MKKVQRSFAVEYKSGRRKTDAKPNSIWGNMDLKSVARDVEDSPMPFLPNSPASEELKFKVSSSEADPILPILTQHVSTPKTAADTQETLMADETDTITDADAPAVVEAQVTPKKPRKPRTKKASPETVATDATADTAVGTAAGNGQKKRGRKPQVVEGAAVGKRAYAKRAPKVEQAAKGGSTPAGDEMADLLQLEEENQKLRKLLAEKLRAENADLRKKLKLN